MKKIVVPVIGCAWLAVLISCVFVCYVILFMAHCNSPCEQESSKSFVISFIEICSRKLCKSLREPVIDFDA
jgi:hypothetical protein